MDAYAALLERTRVPQASLQRFAVIQIFEKLRTAPSYLNSDSHPGMEVITQCLHSSSPAVVDQSVRQLCRLVKESKLDISRGFLELQSALEGSDPRLVDVFVKGMGFLVRFGFKKFLVLKGEATENNPFVKVLLCRPEVQNELVQQMLLFVLQCKHYGMMKVCNFLRPLLIYSILRIPFSDSSSSLFLRLLLSSLASLCCSFPSEALPVFELLINCLKYFQHKSAEDFRNIVSVAEVMIDAHVVVLRHNFRIKLVVEDAQLSGVKLLETILSLCSDFEKYSVRSESIVELSRGLLHVHKELGLHYVPELFSVVLSLFVILSRLELEHEQLCVLKLLSFLLNWKLEDDCNGGDSRIDVPEVQLFIIPVINLMSSPSNLIKRAAFDLLAILEKLPINLMFATRREPPIQGISRSNSTLEVVIYRLLRHLWLEDLPSTSFFLSMSTLGGSCVEKIGNGSKFWIFQLGQLALSIVDRQRSSLSVYQSQTSVLTEISLLLTAVVGILNLHPTLGTCAAEALAALGVMQPRLGLTLLLAIMYYSNLLRLKNSGCHDMSLKLLEILPSLASHTELLPFIVKTITPMIHKDAKPVLHATAIRLLCKTWENNDRIFGSIQAVLVPGKLTDVFPEPIIATSMGASIRDVCRTNPDRGVDLILSVSACIESRDPRIKVLGFQSLAHLCEADVVDFYTGWSVIVKHVLEYLDDPIVSYGLCQLLRWGAMDAEAYPEASKKILQILWGIGQSGHSTSTWIKAKKSAFEALSHFEVVQIQNSIPDLKGKILELLVSETNLDILVAIEELAAKIMAYEHSIRRRFVKERKLSGNKIEKLLEIFPRAIFSSVKTKYASELPGAALLRLPFPPKQVDSKGELKNAEDALAQYVNTVKEISLSLDLSRNIVIALISLESWKPLMQRWMMACSRLFELKSSSVTLDNTLKAANNILKVLLQMAQVSIPRSAENMALAIAALCMVLPPSVHAVKATASKFLLDWLFQYEHEYRQWSAAISLGSISSCLHVTDHTQKGKIIDGLLEVACVSRHSLVKGACGVGLGFSCQALFTREAIVDMTDKEIFAQQEADALGKIVRVLCLMISELTQGEYDILRSLSQYIPPGSSVSYGQISSDLMFCSSDEVDIDIWGVAGLLLGLGGSVGALFRSGSQDAVCDIKSLFKSWIEDANNLLQICDSGSRSGLILLSLGACLALPSVVCFCQKVELVHDGELDHMVVCYRELIYALLSSQTSGSIHQSLLMASCVGAGSLIGCVLNEGIFSLESVPVRQLLESFRETYSREYPPLVHFGGMLGVINTMGACAGTMVHYCPSINSFRSLDEISESARVMGPILASSCLEPLLISLMQDAFLVAKNCDDHQLQSYAAWALSFLRHRLWCKGLQNYSSRHSIGDAQSLSKGVPEDSTVMKLSLWLMQLDSHICNTKVDTVATVLRCLSRAPRLPSLDWGAIMRRCMRYDAQIADMLLRNSFQLKGNLREECLKFLFVHAKNFDPLLSFLDELSELSRFGALDLHTQCSMLSHLSNLTQIFSTSRLERLFSDIAEYLSSAKSSYQKYSSDEKSLLRISCWSGLCYCLDEPSVNSSDYIATLSKCMEVLFCMLPELSSPTSSGKEKIHHDGEWTACIRCLGKAQRAWLLDFLHISEGGLLQRDQHFTMVVKKIKARAHLVKFNSLPMTELEKIKTFLLNSDSRGLWNVLVEVVAALQSVDGTVKRLWIIDALEISCITRYPSTVLQFLGLLCGSCCRYMPLLILDPSAVLNDLPLTLPSLLSSPSWVAVAESLVSHLFTSTERFYSWIVCGRKGDEPAGLEPIDRSEMERADIIMHAMHDTCISLKDYLPLEKQLRLGNMVDF